MVPSFDLVVWSAELEDDWEPTTAEEHEEAWEREQQRNIALTMCGPRLFCAICREGGMLSGAAKKKISAMNVEDDCWGNTEMVQCKDCMVTIHHSCYGVQDGTDGENWQCDRCAVTSKQGGKPRCPHYCLH